MSQVALVVPEARGREDRVADEHHDQGVEHQVGPSLDADKLSGPIRVRRVVPALRRADDPDDRSRLLAARDSIREAVHGLGRTPGLRER